MKPWIYFFAIRELFCLKFRENYLAINFNFECAASGLNRISWNFHIQIIRFYNIWYTIKLRFIISLFAKLYMDFYFIHLITPKISSNTKKKGIKITKPIILKMKSFSWLPVLKVKNFKPIAQKTMDNINRKYKDIPNIF